MNIVPLRSQIWVGNTRRRRLVVAAFVAFLLCVNSLLGSHVDQFSLYSLGMDTVSLNAKVGSKVTGILIGVTASRATFPTRVAEIIKTWASDLPKGVFVRFFVGDPVFPTDITSGSFDDIAGLAQQAGISDESTIVVMEGIQDDEYPLVYKAAAVLEYMDRAIRDLEQQSQENQIDWVFDVDDDTYVHMSALQEFLVGLNSTEHTYIGQRGWGENPDELHKGGLREAYCMGGTGILMAKSTFRVLIDHLDDCIRDAKKKMKIIYDDVLFGICLYKQLKKGCWDGPSFNRDTFAHNYDNSDSFPSDTDLWKTVSLHPHKTPGMMTRTHERFKKFGTLSTTH